MATKTTAFPRFAQVQQSLKGLQNEGEKLITRIRKEAAKLVSKDQRKAIDSLVSQAKAIRADVQKRTEKALKSLETRAEKVYARVESEARKRVEPLVRRLPLPSKHDLELLAKRLSSLEKKVEEIINSKSRAA
jgi:hypothetical protein